MVGMNTIGYRRYSPGCTHPSDVGSRGRGGAQEACHTKVRTPDQASRPHGHDSGGPLPRRLTALPRIDELERFHSLKILVLEPLLEGLSLRGRLKGISWVILDSETALGARPLDLIRAHRWAERLWSPHTVLGVCRTCPI